MNLPLKLVRPLCVSVNEHSVLQECERTQRTARVFPHLSPVFRNTLTLDLILISTHAGIYFETRIHVSKAISGSYI